MSNIELKIEGMSCGHCVSAVRNALQSVPGVDKADVDLRSGRATVSHDGSVSDQALTHAVEEEGYSAKAA